MSDISKNEYGKDFNRIFITGDTHGDFGYVMSADCKYRFSESDLIIILGDVGLNFSNDERDSQRKHDVMKRFPCTFLCLHGNHEMRPDSEGILCKYEKKDWFGGQVFVQKKYDRLLFAVDGSRYHINGRDFLVIGGAYSIDKFIRIERGWPWFPDEQLTYEEKKTIRAEINGHGNHEDIILTHTCPYDFRPTDMFLPGYDQSTVDTTSEWFLQHIYDDLAGNFTDWYCGHWHLERDLDDKSFHFLFHYFKQVKGE